MRRIIIPTLSAVALAGVILAPVAMTNSASAAPASVPVAPPFCPPNVLPAPADILIATMDSYAGSLALGNC
jgi:hypothetical protein